MNTAPHPYSDGVIRLPLLTPDHPDDRQYGDPASAPNNDFTPEDTDGPVTPVTPVKSNLLSKRSSKHTVYAIEILIFTLVGWGWLAIREFMGVTPVMDIAVLLCLLISAATNLALALVYYTTDQFMGPAQGFFAHVLSVWLLYAYSLVESTAGGWGPLCCDGVSTFSVGKTYAAAYFGGLPFHQTAAMVTLAFMTVLLILAAGQVRVCMEDPREWLVGQTTLAVSCLVSFHIGLFALNSRVCGSEMGGAVIGIAVAAWLLMVDPQRAFCCVQTADRAVIQRSLELAFTALLAGVAVGLSASIGGSASSALLLTFGVALAWQGVALGGIVYAQRRPHAQRRPPNSNPDLAPNEDTLTPGGLQYRFRNSYNGRGAILLPGVSGQHGRRWENKAR